MLLAIPIPDWNSLDSVRRVHSDLEAAALIFFALLVLFDVLAHLYKDKPREKLLEEIALCCFGIAVLAEIVAYPYGQRNDELSAGIIGSLDAKAQHADASASSAVQKSETALSKASVAEGKADTANLRADTAASKADAASGVASAAQAAANMAGDKARSVEERTDKLQQQANTLGTVIVAEDKRAIEIIKSMDQRFLAYTVNGENGPDVLDPLRAFPETKVIFEVLPDVEARRAKWELEKLVSFSHWKEIGMSLNPDLFWAYNDGVRVEWGTAPNILSARPGDKGPEAAEALALFLQQHEWIATAGPEMITPASKHEQLPINTIRIVIGFKPNLFFEPWLEESRQESLRSRQRMEELLKSLQKK